MPRANLPLHVVEIRGLRGKGALGWLLLPFRLVRAIWQAGRVLRKSAPSCAVSFGGYAAGPGGLAAWLRGVPVLVHEQNRIPGLTNRSLARLAKTVLQAFPGTFDESRSPQTTGNPVRTSLRELPAPQSRFESRDGPARLLVTGGSQGARVLNEVLPRALALLPAGSHPSVRHQCGRGHEEQTSAAYAAAGVDADVTEFIEDMADAYGWADLVVCRSGALTVSELAVAGVGSLLVPFQYAVDDHQARNAEVLVEAGAARMIRESELNAEDLAAVLVELLGSRERMLDMAGRARSVGMPDAAERVADACSQWVSG